MPVPLNSGSEMWDLQSCNQIMPAPYNEKIIYLFLVLNNG